MNAKERIKKFWNNKPCGTFGVIPEEVDLPYFEKIRDRRYKLEPFIKTVVDFLSLKEKKVLEVGCGIGIDGMEFSKAGADYTGIDASETSINLARRYFEFEKNNSPLIVADTDSLPFVDNSFDYVFSWGVIHHTPNIRKAVEEIYRVLKPGGECCIMVYNRRSIVGAQLYVLYGLFRLNPFANFKKLFAEHHESPGTKAFTNKETLLLFKKFKDVKIVNIVTPYDLRIGRNRYLPNLFKYLIPAIVGFFKVIKGRK